MRISESRFLECPNCGHNVPIEYETNGWLVRGPADVYDKLSSMGLLDREELRVVLLDIKNNVKDVQTIYVGNVSASLVRVAEVIQPAIKSNFPSIMVVHNHPSNDPTPSPDDMHLTAEVLAACNIMDIKFLDHIIIAKDSYVSLRDRGVSFNA